MKRSDMVSVIAYDLMNSDSDFWMGAGVKNNPLSKDYATYLANYVLLGLEKEGMVPPKTVKQYEVSKGITASKEVNEWDNE